MALDPEMAQDAERDQRDDALAAGRDLMHSQSRVIERDAVRPEAFMARQIIRRHYAVVPGAVCRNFLCQITPVKTFSL